MKRDDIEPLFKSGHEACCFAYAYSSQQYAMTAMAKMMKGSGYGSGRGLIGLDGAAVAGTVKRHVEELSMPYPLIIAARHEIDCRSRMASVIVLAGLVIPVLGTGGHSRRMVQELVMHYFRIPYEGGKEVKLAVIADRYGVHASTVTRAWRPIKDRLREWESKAQDFADRKLSDAGLVP